MTGTLHQSLPPSGSASGTFFLSLSENTLTYSVTTRSLSAVDFDLSAANFSLNTETESIPLPLFENDTVGFDGCSLTFAAFGPLSQQLPESGFVFFPLGIADPGNCRSAFQVSVLKGSVEIPEAQLPLFDRPDFTVSVGTLTIFGQTDPNVTGIPEPAAVSYFCLVGLVIGRRRRRS
jgi:hypothetical protein